MEEYYAVKEHYGKKEQDAEQQRKNYAKKERYEEKQKEHYARKEKYAEKVKEHYAESEHDQLKENGDTTILPTTRYGAGSQHCGEITMREQHKSQQEKART